MTPEPAQPAESPEAREVLAAAFEARGFEVVARGCRNGSVDTMLLAMLDAMQTFAASTARPTERGAVEAWEENVRYLLDNEPSAVRVHEGGAAQENLIASLSVSWLKLQKAGLAVQLAEFGDWVLVPREPTEAMIEAYHESEIEPESAWLAMIDAAPYPPLSATDQAAEVGEWRDIEASLSPKGRRRSPKYYPAIGETCRMSGPNCDDTDGYTWADVEVLWRDDLFIVTRVPKCWPTVTKLELALFEPAALATQPATERSDRHEAHQHSERLTPATGRTMGGEVFDIQPQLSDSRYGPEPSLRQAVRYYYFRNGQPDPDGDTEQYFAALQNGGE